MTSDLSAGMGADAAALVAAMAPAIDDTMLMDIALSDYGQSADEHFPQLQRLRDHQALDIPTGWHPEEVLQLTSFSTPDNPSKPHAAVGLRGHYMRAFSCACLLYERVFEGNARRGDLEGDNQDLIKLLDSLDRIDNPDYYRAAIRHLAYALGHWLEEREVEEEKPFLILGLLYLGLKIDLPSDWVGRIAQWVLDEEGRIRSTSFLIGADENPAWLLGLTCFDGSHDRWVALGSALMSLSQHVAREQGASHEAASLVHLIGQRLACQTPKPDPIKRIGSFKRWLATIT